MLCHSVCLREHVARSPVRGCSRCRKLALINDSTGVCVSVSQSKQAGRQASKGRNEEEREGRERVSTELRLFSIHLRIEKCFPSLPLLVSTVSATRVTDELKDSISGEE